MDHSSWAVTLGSLTCEEGGNLSTRDLSFIYVSSEGWVSCEFIVIHPAQPTDAPSSRRFRSHFYTLGFPSFRGLVPLGRRNMVPILPPAHPLGGELLTSVQPISITKTLLIVPTKNERDPPLFTGKLLIKFQNILRNTTQVIIRHRVKIVFSVISSPITLERQKWKSSKKKRILLSPPVNSW
jgi:hypothetical protein